MKNTVKINSVESISVGSLYYVATLPDNLIDLIVTDPSCFRVKPNGWDNQWKRDEDYLRWPDSYLAEYARALKPAGGIYLFCGHRLASDIEIMMHVRFNVLNHMIWVKPLGRWSGCNKENLCAYFPSAERILLAEHYLGPYTSKEDVYERKSAEPRQRIMAPLVDYFRNARESLGASSKEIAKATGKRNMASHWFGAGQWQLPNEIDYRKLQELFTWIAIDKHIQQKLEHPHRQLVATYQSLNRKYSELLEECKTFWRCFSVSAFVPYTDVWTYKPIQFCPGKHPYKKPADTLKQIISASSRPGDIATDFFTGSGSAVRAAVELGRRAIGVELKTDRLIQATEEVEKLNRT